jgi:cytidine deaminase
MELESADLLLIEEAKNLIAARYRENRHHIAAAVRGASGAVYTGLHLDTYVGRASVCAEAVALGAALSAGETKIEAIVSVRHPRPREATKDIAIVSPCGICREMLADFAPEAKILIRHEGAITPANASQLLPEKYRRP